MRGETGMQNKKQAMGYMAKGAYDAGFIGVEIKEFLLWAHKTIDGSKKYDNWDVIQYVNLYAAARNLAEAKKKEILSGCYWAFDSFDPGDAGKLYNSFIMINHLWQLTPYREGE
jgi:hypothetical protein